MRITLLTSNQPRHLSFIEALLPIADELFVVQETTTVFPGIVPAFFKSSTLMQAYFEEVLGAEKRLFGDFRFSPASVPSLNLYPGDLKLLHPEQLGDAQNADLFIVYGTGLISGALCDFLVSKKAVNIHMGTAPYYRGASCNMWALHDKKPELVSGTVHLLSAKLDHGDILFQALPPARAYDPFDLGMMAVKVVQEALVAKIENGSLYEQKPVAQETLTTGRNCKNAEFTDEIANDLLSDKMSPEEIRQKLLARNLQNYILPVMK